MSPPRTGRTVWTIFVVGMVVWIVQLVSTLLLVRGEATFYPGTIHMYGGEWDGI